MDAKDFVQAVAAASLTSLLLNESTSNQRIEDSDLTSDWFQLLLLRRGLHRNSLAKAKIPRSDWSASCFSERHTAKARSRFQPEQRQ